jgi:hypothetical protein
MTEPPLHELVLEFMQFMDKEEESDSGRKFHPNVISSVRCMDAPRMEKLLQDMKAQAYKDRQMFEMAMWSI